MNKQYPCTLPQLATLLNGLAAHGIPVTADPTIPNAGQFTSEGVTLGYVFQAPATVNVTILKKGIFPTAAMVWDALDEYVNFPVQPQEPSGS